MRDAARQVPDRLHLLSLTERLLGPLATGRFGHEAIVGGLERRSSLGDEVLQGVMKAMLGLFNLAFLGTVAQNLEKAEQRAGVIALGHEHPGSEELRPVPTHMPTLVRSTALFKSFAHLGFGHTRPSVFS